MKPLVLFIVFLEIIFSLAEDKKCFCLCAGPKGDAITKPIGYDENQIERRFQWTPGPQNNGQLCDGKRILPLKLNNRPTNVAWRTNQAESKDQNQRWHPWPPSPQQRYQWTPPPQQRDQGCLNPPPPSRVGMNPMILPAQSPSNPAWRTSPVQPWTTPLQPKFQGCPIPPKPWPRFGTDQPILPASSPSSFGWRPNQGMYNWMNPFDFGLQNYYPHWGYPSQFQNSMFPRPPAAPNMGMPLSLPMQPAMNRPWGIPPFVPPRRWHMQFFGTPNGGYPMNPWNVMSHIGSSFAPFYLPDRNQFYKK